MASGFLLSLGTRTLPWISTTENNYNFWRLSLILTCSLNTRTTFGGFPSRLYRNINASSSKSASWSWSISHGKSCSWSCSAEGGADHIATHKINNTPGWCHQYHKLAAWCGREKWPLWCDHPSWHHICSVGKWWSCMMAVMPSHWETVGCSVSQQLAIVRMATHLSLFAL